MVFSFNPVRDLFGTSRDDDYDDEDSFYGSGDDDDYTYRDDEQDDEDDYLEEKLTQMLSEKFWLGFMKMDSRGDPNQTK